MMLGFKTGKFFCALTLRRKKHHMVSYFSVHVMHWKFVKYHKWKANWSLQLWKLSVFNFFSIRFPCMGSNWCPTFWLHQNILMDQGQNWWNYYSKCAIDFLLLKIACSSFQQSCFSFRHAMYLVLLFLRISRCFLHHVSNGFYMDTHSFIPGFQNMIGT